MNKIEIETFLKSIQVVFCQYLYKYKYKFEIESNVHFNNKKNWCRLEYPFCCKLASNIISSYLTIHSGYTCKCVYTLNFSTHCWCECEELGMAIDYTGLQYKLSSDEKEMFKNHSITEECMNDILSRSKIVFEICDYTFRQNYYDLGYIDNLALNKAKSITSNQWTLDSFMNYVELACDFLKYNTIVMSYK